MADKKIFIDLTEMYQNKKFSSSLILFSHMRVIIEEKKNFYSLEDEMRIGIGYDVHKLVEGRDLIIGGISIPHEKGLLGHSDADVLTHAIMDALLGAAALGDLGTHFPDTAEEFKDADSLVLLDRVKEILADLSFKIINIDAVIIAQEPKMKPHIPMMREKLSKVLSLPLEDINIKATTEEGLGFTGSKEGISSQAVVLIDKRY